MNGRIVVVIASTMFFSSCLTAQKGVTVSVNTFKVLVGCWEGTLNYSGTMIRKPYATTVRLVVAQGATANILTLTHVYTSNSSDNVIDTLLISNGGRMVNRSSIVARRSTGDSGTQVVTEASGFDHDNNEAARIRETYTVSNQTYTYKKQVQLQGQTEWLDRQDFVYRRTDCTGQQ